MEVNLLPVLEEKKITKVGDTEPIDVDLRLISSNPAGPGKKGGCRDFPEGFFSIVLMQTRFTSLL